jgi:hypothetical protein
VRVHDEVNLHNRKRGRLVQVKWNGVTNLVGTTLSTSFTQATTFGRRHHSPPYNTLCAFPWGLHPNVTFPRDSHLGVPKLGLSLSQNFGHSYLSQIKFILKIRGHYLIALKNIFSTMYLMPQLELVWPLFSRGLWLGVKFPIWLPPLLLIITHAN